MKIPAQPKPTAARRARTTGEVIVDIRMEGLTPAPLLEPQAAQKGPDARRRPKVAREAYSLYVERAAEGANEADGPFSAAWATRTCWSRPAGKPTPRWRGRGLNSPPPRGGS